MKKADLNLLKQCIDTLIEVQKTMEDASILHLVQSAGSQKKDALHLDTLPEGIIATKLVDDYDDDIVLVTEERGGVNCRKLCECQHVVFIDPADRSKQFQAFLQSEAAKITSRATTFGEILNRGTSVDAWSTTEKMPLQLSAPTCSVCVVKDGVILFALLLNYFSRQIFVAVDNLVVVAPIARLLKSTNIVAFDSAPWERITFQKVSQFKTFVTFLGKKNYPEYLSRSGLLDDTYLALDENEPGGPARVLYLSDLCPKPPGLVLANGEKIAEWIGWLAFARASQSLVAYAVYPDAVFAKDEILVAPSPPYSVLDVTDGVLRLNYEKLCFFENPSRYREMIAIMHVANTGMRASIDGPHSRKLICP